MTVTESRTEHKNTTTKKAKSVSDICCRVTACATSCVSCCHCCLIWLLPLVSSLRKKLKMKYTEKELDELFASGVLEDSGEKHASLTDDPHPADKLLRSRYDCKLQIPPPIAPTFFILDCLLFGRLKSKFPSTTANATRTSTSISHSDLLKKWCRPSSLTTCPTSTCHTSQNR